MEKEAAASAALAERIRRKNAEKAKQDNPKEPAAVNNIFKQLEVVKEDEDSDDSSDDDVDLALLTRRVSAGGTAKRSKLSKVDARAAIPKTKAWSTSETIGPARGGGYEYGY